METILRYVIIAAVGALASILANQSIAVFNDGLRPVLPEYLEKRMDRKALAATSFAIGFGLVIGYGLPTSIAASIILIHCILLTTDIIGTWCPDTKKGMIVSGVIGAVYGVALLFGLQVIIDLFNLLPVNFLGSLGQVSAGITLAFAIFPAVTVALQFGAAKGIITAVVTLLVRQIVETYGKIALDAEHTISLNKDGMALLAGMIIMLVFAAMDKEGNDQNSNEMLTQIFADKVARIRKYMPVLALMGGLIAAGTSMSIMAGDPISLGLLAEGDRVNAGLTALARAIGFIPLVATTAITTGVYRSGRHDLRLCDRSADPQPLYRPDRRCSLHLRGDPAAERHRKGSGQVPRHQALRRQHPYRYELRHRHRPADRRHPGCSGNHAHDGSVHHRGILVHQQVQQEASGLHGGRSSGRDPGRPDRKRAVPAVSVHPCRLIPG